MVVNSERAIEKFCNDVASMFLLTEEELTDGFDYSTLERVDSTIQEIDRCANFYKVSSRFIAYRLFLRGDINQESFSTLGRFFFDRWSNVRMQQKDQARNTDGGPSYYVIRKHKIGAALLATSERLLRSGELSTTRAARVLGVRPLKLEKMFSERLPI